MMSRNVLFDEISDRMTFFYQKIHTSSKLNMTSENCHAEPFFASFLNKLLGLKLEDANRKKRNQAGFDLIDKDNKCLAQVSSTCTVTKIKESLSVLHSWQGWRFVFIPITTDEIAVKSVKKGSYPTGGPSFSADADVYDLTRILQEVKSLPAEEEIREIRDFLRKEVRFPSVRLDEEVKSLPFVDSKCTIYYISRNVMGQALESGVIPDVPEDVSVVIPETGGIYRYSGMSCLEEFFRPGSSSVKMTFQFHGGTCYGSTSPSNWDRDNWDVESPAGEKNGFCSLLNNLLSKRDVDISCVFKVLGIKESVCTVQYLFIGERGTVYDDA